MGAGVKIIVISREQLHALKILFQHVQAVLPGLALRRAEVHRIAAVGHQRPEVFPVQQIHQRRSVPRQNILRLSAPGVPCKIRKGVPAELQHGLAHGLIAFGHRQMAADVNQRFCIHLITFSLTRPEADLIQN